MPITKDKPPAVELDSVTKRFGTHVAVAGLSLVVPRGSIYGFIGPNGSGKTSTLRMIMNILQPDAREVRVLGETMSGACSVKASFPNSVSCWAGCSAADGTRPKRWLHSRRPG